MADQTFFDLNGLEPVSLAELIKIARYHKRYEHHGDVSCSGCTHDNEGYDMRWPCNDIRMVAEIIRCRSLGGTMETVH